MAETGFFRLPEVAFYRKFAACWTGAFGGLAD
jgi:hypothetical protein